MTRIAAHEIMPGDGLVSPEGERIAAVVDAYLRNDEIVIELTMSASIVRVTVGKDRKIEICPRDDVA